LNIVSSLLVWALAWSLALAIDSAAASMFASERAEALEADLDSTLTALIVPRRRAMVIAFIIINYKN
jgi:hypothetical protein